MAFPKAKQWIKEAVSKHPGSFTAQAKAAGMSISAFASKVLKKGSPPRRTSGTTRKRAVEYRTLMSFHRK